MLSFRQIEPQNAPMHLLLEADPSEAKVTKYLKSARCYVAVSDEEVAGVCVLNALDDRNKDDKTIELFNIAVSPDRQGQGVGKALLQFVIKAEKRRGISCIELGTGTFGYQLAFYQRLGFRVDSVVKNFFLDNYDEPIYEMGIQHKDMLRLVLHL
ncbi:GNAT family N-acetyltransferase [Photobacterium proteolyticum]|uniref:GNAT family N-acetyltransferase n=1 Tax=Photobacterium proteolyticum TaxID=1903952 RepID=A0A1Q9G721_9GAMM|nr:GNAT family N-acetyltransferase [Photobacterium proteolyticum]OLQ70082.1 GNAT family N-acetyltransferase [Photobacterium proteolyticum]